MVVRPTSGDGRIPTKELEVILPQIGFDFIVMKSDLIIKDLD
jgi:hypothetical protein